VTRQNSLGLLVSEKKIQVVRLLLVSGKIKGGGTEEGGERILEGSKLLARNNLTTVRERGYAEREEKCVFMTPPAERMGRKES